MPLESGSAATPIPKWCGSPRGIADGSVLAGVLAASTIISTIGSAQIRRITVNVSARASAPRDELQPVPERVVQVEPAMPLELDVARDLDALLGQAPLEVVEVGHQERGMGFARGPEVRLHAE